MEPGQAAPAGTVGIQPNSIEPLPAHAHAPSIVFWALPAVVLGHWHRSCSPTQLSLGSCTPTYCYSPRTCSCHFPALLLATPGPGGSQLHGWTVGAWDPHWYPRTGVWGARGMHVSMQGRRDCVCAIPLMTLNILFLQLLSPCAYQL